MGLFRKNVSNFIIPVVINSAANLTANQAGSPPTIPAGTGTPVGSPAPYTSPVGAAGDLGSAILVQQYATSGNGTNAVSQGVEVYAQHVLPFGVGFQVNFTYNDTNLANVTVNGQNIGKSPLVGSAKTQFNASVFYENDIFTVRGSYNRRGSQYGDLVSGLNVIFDPYQQLDLNASVNLMKNLALTGRSST